MNNLPNNYFVFNSIGVIHSPYKNKAPNQPLINDQGDFKIVLNEKFTKGLKLLDTFTYIYVIYYLDKVIRNNEMIISPPWANQQEVGVFASRSPNRPNPIGISIVKILKIIENKIYISGIDAFDETPVLDIKPYIDKLDAKSDANYGWVNIHDNEDHLALHIQGIPHKH
ncbi:MAG: tRNA (N6-threonylcarbamoyladenosine(37)-N6)-methyltransferase TrmO [Bacteroidota bacterium]